MSKKFETKMRKKLGDHGAAVLALQLSRYLRVERPEGNWLEWMSTELDEALKGLSFVEKGRLRKALVGKGLVSVRPKKVSRGRPEYLYKFKPENLKAIERDFGAIVHEGKVLEVAEVEDHENKFSIFNAFNPNAFSKLDNTYERSQELERRRQAADKEKRDQEQAAKEEKDRKRAENREALRKLEAGEKCVGWSDGRRHTYQRRLLP